MTIDMRRIRELRLAKKWTQKQLADKIYSSQQSITDWETGKKMPSLVAVADCADAFGVSVDYLLCRTDCPYTVVRSTVENGEIICFTQQKSPQLEAEGAGEIISEFSLEDEALPTNRKELEQLVESLLRKALSGGK